MLKIWIHKVENFSRELEPIKRNQMEILDNISKEIRISWI